MYIQAVEIEQRWIKRKDYYVYTPEHAPRKSWFVRSRFELGTVKYKSKSFKSLKQDRRRVFILRDLVGIN